MSAAYSNLKMSQLVESLPMYNFREELLKKASNSKEFSKLISSGASALSADDREVVISILTEALPSINPVISDEELDGLAESISSRAVSLR